MRRLRRTFRRVGRALRLRHKTHTRSVVATQAGAGAVLAPYAVQDSGGNTTIDHVINTITSKGSDVASRQNIIPSFINGLWASIGTQIGLAAYAGGEHYLARRTGLDKATQINSKWSIF